MNDIDVVIIRNYIDSKEIFDPEFNLRSALPLGSIKSVAGKKYVLASVHKETNPKLVLFRMYWVERTEYLRNHTVCPVHLDRFSHCKCKISGVEL